MDLTTLTATFMPTTTGFTLEMSGFMTNKLSGNFGVAVRCQGVGEGGKGELNEKICPFGDIIQTLQVFYSWPSMPWLFLLARTFPRRT